MRRSRITGSDGLLVLRDGAVGVLQPMQYVTRVTADGKVWRTPCHCGPAAPRPGRYTETIGQMRGEACYIIREELPDGRIRTFTHRYLDYEARVVGVEYMWRMVRARYLRWIGVQR